MRRRPLLVSFGGSARVGHLDASFRMSQLPPLPPLLHLADLLGEKGFKCGDELGEDFKVPKANLNTEEREETRQVSVQSYRRQNRVR